MSVLAASHSPIKRPRWAWVLARVSERTNRNMYISEPRPHQSVELADKIKNGDVSGRPLLHTTMQAKQQQHKLEV